MNDPRQQLFHKATGYIKKNLTTTYSGGIDNIFPASYVNLGWLKDKIKELIEKQEIKKKEDIESFVLDAVQRPKTIYVHKNKINEKKYFYTIKFQTKDDFGWYGYEFDTSPIEKK